MKTLYPGILISLFLFTGLISAEPSATFKSKQPLLKAELASAIYYTIPDTMRFQYGPSLDVIATIRGNNLLGLQIEHLYWEAQSHQYHYGLRSALINLQWFHYYSTLTWGIEYIVSVNRRYDKNPYTLDITKTNSVGLTGMGVSLCFTLNLLTISGEAKFANTDGFNTESGLLSLFGIGASIRLAQWAAIQLEYRFWQNSEFYREAPVEEEYLSRYDEKNQSMLLPAMRLEWKNFHFSFGPAISTKSHSSHYENRITFLGKLGYSLNQRPKK